MLTTDAIQSIHAFSPIISKAAMQTYLSALPLMSSASPLLFKKYFVMSRPRIKSWGPRSSVCRIIHSQRVILSAIGGTMYDSRHLITLSPDGRWIAIENRNQRALDMWNVETLSNAKTIAKGCDELDSDFDTITHSADGKKVMIVTISYSNPSRPAVGIWDVKTDKLVMRPGVLTQFLTGVDEVAISPDGSQIAVAPRFSSRIQIIDVSTGHLMDQITLNGSYYSIRQLIWSPNGQFFAIVNLKDPYATISTREIYLLSLGRSIKAPDLCLGSPTEKYIIALAFSPDSSKVAATYRDGVMKDGKTLLIWCTQTRILIGTTSFELTGDEVTIAFTRDNDILVCAYDLYRSTIVLLRFNVLATFSTQTYTHYPPKFDPSETPLTIAYSHDTSGAIVDYASQVDADGWIFNTKGERQIWTPWANYELSCFCEPSREGQTQYRTLEVKDPETKTVVLRYVIAFEQLEDAVNQIQGQASVE